MRSRSGAIHSDTAQDFLIMAELSQSKTGIFYDQQTNKKIMSQIQKSQKPKLRLKPKQPKMTRCAEKSQEVFKNFNFSTPTEQSQEQASELNKKGLDFSKVIRLGIITQNLDLLKCRIATQTHLQIDLPEQLRFIDLLIVSTDQLLFKIWLFDADLFKGHKLAYVYFTNCHLLYTETNSHFILETAKSQLCKESAEKYLSFLNQ